MVSTSRSGDVTVGSYATVAPPVIRFTFADRTPSARSSERCTRPLQAAQVIPATGMVHDSVGSAGAVVVMGLLPGLGDEGATHHSHPAGEFVRTGRRREAD